MDHVPSDALVFFLGGWQSPTDPVQQEFSFEASA
jgi:hypothetical protein